MEKQSLLLAVAALDSDLTLVKRLEHETKLLQEKYPYFAYDSQSRPTERVRQIILDRKKELLMELGKLSLPSEDTISE